MSNHAGETLPNEAYAEAAAYLTAQTSIKPEIGLILGSGLGVLGDHLTEVTTIPYASIPHFPVSTVEGHAGELMIGYLNGRPVVLMRGRFHMYEGYGPELTSFPVRVMQSLGVAKLIVTNAAGGINTGYDPGDLMLITDHINLTGRNPLIGANDDRFGVRFPDMSEAYSRKFRAIAQETAQASGFSLREGVYVGVLGPSYETPAEIRMMRTLGADAVGMSTVAEVIAARHCGIEVLGISCISNMASGILDQPLSHDEVIETTERVKARFLKLVSEVVTKL
ncbi:purine nucleoside phosphorylase I, inosine and guanosine-specific [Paenibacillus curdlanolyticus YK9]|uniref:Purine nucleoside phosphorylase n=1 Tax=Paenibacillus curdlanolyticus YK9 TaxID=717606 RepID=E0ICF8_9BACL|nr:purine-nucleoside phosphorylase [Paenibacillus curdlanolyticus]EFM09844.1 purine nucleoside phosphorylase I, inosine and guanosine-specific [Paenibacillus curdlanolyticus YK9]